MRDRTDIGTAALSDRLIAFAEAAGVGTDAVRRVSDRALGLYVIRVNDGERTFS